MTKDEWCHLGAEELARLDHACMIVGQALDTCYLVGSVLERPDYRDVDVRVVLDDERYDALFGGAGHQRTNALWSLLCLSVTEYLSRVTKLRIDFQVQRRTEANQKFDGPCHPLGIYPYRYANDDEECE